MPAIHTAVKSSSVFTTGVAVKPFLGFRLQWFTGRRRVRCSSTVVLACRHEGKGTSLAEATADVYMHLTTPFWGPHVLLQILNA